MQIKLGVSKWIVNPVIGLLITLGTRSSMFTYLAVLLAVASIALYNEIDSLCVLLFSLSFTHIFKSAPGSTSFFIILMLFYVGWNILRTRQFSHIIGEIIVFVSYVVVVHLANGMMQIAQLLKFAANFLFLYVATRDADYKRSKDLFLSYVCGVLFSSLLVVSEAFPQIVFYMDGNFEADRFCGMHSDPNYYGVNLIISLCLVVVMYHRKEIPVWLTLVLTGLLIWFCSLTVSKMVFLMLLIPCMLFMYSNFINRRIWLQFVFMGILVALVSMVLSGQIDAFDAVLKRFESVDDAASLTTGRSVKWEEYFSYIFGSMRVMLFGEGLNAPYSLASHGVPHNTYIDFLYNLGFVGTAGWIWSISRIFSINVRVFKRKIINVSLFACVMLTWISLSELTYFDLPFHLFLAFVVWNIPMDVTKSDMKICFTV